MRFTVFLLATLAFAIIAIIVIAIGNKVINSMEKDNAKNDVEVRKIYKDEENENA